MANPVSVQDVEQRWRLFSHEEFTTAQALLDDVWSLITLKVPDIEDRLTDETLDPGLVRLVACGAVLRVMKNLDGKRQEALEDYSYVMGDQAAPGTLYLDETELQLLRPAPPVPSGAFTVRPFHVAGATVARPGPPYVL